jgi:hypothetical protein
MFGQAYTNSRMVVPPSILHDTPWGSTSFNIIFIQSWTIIKIQNSFFHNKIVLDFNERLDYKKTQSIKRYN